MSKAPSILILPEPYLEPTQEVLASPNPTTLVNSPIDSLTPDIKVEGEKVEDKTYEEFINLAYLEDYLNDSLKPVEEVQNLKETSSGRIRLFVENDKGFEGQDSFQNFSLATYKSLVTKSCWFDIQNCTPSDLKFINQMYEVDGSYLKDNLKIKKENKSKLITLLSLDKCQTGWLSLTCLQISKNITITFHDGTFINPIKKIHQKLISLQPSVNLQSDLIVYGLYDQLQLELQLEVDKLTFEVDTMEEGLLDERNDAEKFKDPDQFLKVLNLTKLKLNKLSFIVHTLPNDLKFTKLNINNGKFKRDPKLYFGDVKGRLDNINFQVLHIESVLRRINFMYTDQLTLSTIQANNATFDTTMFFTYFGMATSILILTSGMWGMNVHVPGQAQEAPEDAGGNGDTVKVEIPPEGNEWFLVILFGSLVTAAFVWTAFKYYSYRKLR